VVWKPIVKIGSDFLVVHPDESKKSNYKNKKSSILKINSNDTHKVQCIVADREGNSIRIKRSDVNVDGSLSLNFFPGGKTNGRLNAHFHRLGGGNDDKDASFSGVMSHVMLGVRNVISHVIL
jgi:hypothetical protein